MKKPERELRAKARFALNYSRRPLFFPMWMDDCRHDDLQEGLTGIMCKECTRGVAYGVLFNK